MVMDLDYFAGLCKQKYSEHDIPKNWPQLSRPDHYDFLIHTIAAERGLDNKLSLGSGKKSDKAHAHALANRLLLFSYAIGELPITFGFGDARRKRFVNGRGDLYLLHGNEQFFYLPDGSVNQTDPLLLALYTAITKSSSSKRYKVFNWEETIDVVGSDSILKRVLCMEGGFTWQDVLRCPIPGHPKKKVNV